MTNEKQLLRGDVWLVDFGIDPQDPEQAFLRPAVIVSENRLHHPNLRTVIVVPGTSTIRGIPLHVVLSPDPNNGLSTETAFQVEQVRATSSPPPPRRWYLSAAGSPRVISTEARRSSARVISWGAALLSQLRSRRLSHQCRSPRCGALPCRPTTDCGSQPRPSRCRAISEAEPVSPQPPW